jgi:cytochrome P450
MISDILEFKRDPLGAVIDGMRRGTALVRYRFGPFRAVLANRSEDIEHVLVKNHENYVKGRNYEPLKLTLGEGLVTSEGSLWREQRKLVQPAFHHRSLAGFADTMSRTTSELLLRWSAAKDGALDIHHEMMRLTFRIVGLTLFSSDVESEADRIGEAMRFLLDWTNRRTDSIIRWPLWLPTPGNMGFRRHRRVFDELIFGLIHERRRQPPREQGDLLDMLLATEMPDQLIRDEVLTLAVAGHETTANALSWTFYLLSRHPEVERRLHEEARDVLGDRPATLADLGKLELTERVIKESMRLYPPVWGFERQALREDTIAGEKIHPGTIVMMVPYTLHRDPSYWPNPEGFDPERFLADRDKQRPRFAYIPFGGGPRVCIGNAFAMMEAKIILAMIVARHRLELIPGHRVEPEPSITLRPRYGVQVSLHSRAPQMRVSRLEDTVYSNG